MSGDGFPGLSTGDGKGKGKSINALQSSRKSRSDLIAQFGGIDNLPSSVMKADRQKPVETTDEHGTKRSYGNTDPLVVSGKIKTIENEAARGTFRVSGRGCGSGALSIFPQNICKTIIRMYSEEGDVVFDPFAGHNSRMESCASLGRHYIGCDLSTPFMEFNRKRAAELRSLHPDIKIKLIHGDSRKIPVRNEIGDFTVTCYDDDTEVLTLSGWKKFANVSFMDDIATLNTNTGNIEYQKPTTITESEYSGEMFRISTPFVDLRVTPNHNLYVQRAHKQEYELIQARDLPPKGYYRMRSSGNWTGHECPTFDIPAIPENEKKTGTGHNNSEKVMKSFRTLTVPMDPFLKFMGYWLSEGSLGNDQGTVTLTVKEHQTAEKFKAVVDSLQASPPARIYNQGDIHRVTFYSRRIHRYLRQFGKAADKYVPKEILSLSKRQLHILFDALMIGDGNKAGSRYWTVSEKLRDDVMEIAFKLGYGTSHSPFYDIAKQRKRHLNGHLIQSNYPCWTVHIRKERPDIFLSTCGWKDGTKCFLGWEANYNGMVRCVSVPNKVIYVRRNGKAVWCGNSPPYWDIEYYGDEPEQMAECKTYDEFLCAMQLVMNENYRALKPGAFAVWCINDFRKKGVFYSYHSDVISMGKAAGFVQWDIFITDFGKGLRDIFVNQAVEQKIMPKRHEYGVVFRKPGWEQK